METNRNLLKNAFLTSIILLITGITRVIYNAVVGKSFDADILGQINIVISLSILCSMLVSTICEGSAVKFLSAFLAKHDEENIKYSITIIHILSVGISLIFLSILYLFRDIISLKLNIDENFILIAIPLIFLMIIRSSYRGYFYGLAKINLYSKLEFVSAILFFVSLYITIFVCKQYSISSERIVQFLLIPYIFYQLSLIILGFQEIKLYLCKITRISIVAREIIFYGLIACIGPIASTTKANIANIFTGAYLSTEQVGYYSAAVSITAILMYAPSIMSRVLLPHMSFSHGQDNDAELTHILNKTSLWLCITVLFFGGNTIIFSKELLSVIFNPEFSIAAFSLQTLIIGFSLSAIVVPSISALSATKYVKIPNIASVIGLLVSLALWPYLIPRFGLDGTALGYILGTPITIGIIFYYSRKVFGLQLKPIIRINLIGIIILFFAFQISPIISFYSDYVASFIFSLLLTIYCRRELFEIIKSFSRMIRVKY